MPDQSPRLYIPALGRIYERFSPCVEAALRIALGAILIPHGCQKLFGWFGGAGLGKFATIFGKIGHKPGLFPRLAALAVLIFMLNAIYVTSAKGFFWTAGGFEYSLLIGFVALYFLI